MAIYAVVITPYCTATRSASERTISPTEPTIYRETAVLVARSIGISICVGNCTRSCSDTGERNPRKIRVIPVHGDVSVCIISMHFPEWPSIRRSDVGIEVKSLLIGACIFNAKTEPGSSEAGNARRRFSGFEIEGLTDCPATHSHMFDRYAVFFFESAS